MGVARCRHHLRMQPLHRASRGARRPRGLAAMSASASLMASFYALLTVLITGTQNITIRLAADHGAHSFQIVLFRNLFGLLSVVAIILWTERRLPKSRYAGVIALACITHVASMLAGYFGIAVLPLNESAALAFAM